MLPINPNVDQYMGQIHIHEGIILVKTGEGNV